MNVGQDEPLGTYENVECATIKIFNSMYDD